MKLKLLILIMITFAVGSFAYAQEDTVKIIEKPSGDKPIIRYEMGKSPMGAIWRSLVLPGWGQYYVESYWKVPLFLGATGTLIVMIAWNDDKYRDFKHKALAVESQLENPLSPTAELQLLRRQREFYRDQRDMAGFYMLGVYVIATVDAYVGAHLYDFNVDDPHSLTLLPGTTGGLQLRYSFKF